ncbi:MAG: hypothetical protein WCT18_04570 [Patescibacteria group bacterium]
MSEEKKVPEPKITKFDPVKFEYWKVILGEWDAIRLYAEVLPREEIERLSLEELLLLKNISTDNENYEFILERSLVRLSYAEICRKYLLAAHRKDELVTSACKKKLLNLSEDSLKELQGKYETVFQVMNSFVCEKSRDRGLVSILAKETCEDLAEPIIKPLEKQLNERLEISEFGDLFKFYKKGPEAVENNAHFDVYYRLRKIALDIFVKRAETVSFQELFDFVSARSIDYHEIRNRLLGVLSGKGTLSDWVRIYREKKADPTCFSTVHIDFTWQQVQRLAVENQ